MTREVLTKSEQTDLNKERNFYFRKTKSGRLFFIGLVTLFAILNSYLYIVLPGNAVEGFMAYGLVFASAWLISLLLVIAGFFIMDSGYHVSAAWEGHQKRVVELGEAEITFDGKRYRYDDVEVFVKPYESYIVFSGSKVLYVSKYNCPEYNELLSSLNH